MNDKIKKHESVCIDANTAVSYISYAVSDIAWIYPITPSSPMAEYADLLSSNGVKNIFGNDVKVIEMQSESGVAGAIHGSLISGVLATTYTSSQGLLLMIPNMYKIAGELLPAVFHVAARTVATHALNIFCDHSDVMSARQTGFCMLCSNNVQESMDMALISHIVALKSSLPFLHFFDGFRTSHEINKVDKIPYEDIKKLIPYDAIEKFRNRVLSPNHPKQMGTTQNSDIFFQNREASNKYYDAVYDNLVNTMEEFGKITNRYYQPFMYVGSKTPKHLIVMMGSGADTAEITINSLNKINPIYGLIKIHLFRPFNAKEFVKLIPSTVKTISVLDRTKEPGSIGEPLFLDVVAAVNNSISNHETKIFSGRYGLGGKDFTINNVLSILDNAESSMPKEKFSIGINDDVSHCSLSPSNRTIDMDIDNTSMLFYGLGSDGTVSANKSSIKIIGENTKKYVQAYFEYDSKKSGSVTTSHLRVFDKPIHMPFLVNKASFIAIHNYSFVHLYDVLKPLSNNGIILINTPLTQEQLERDLPENFKKHLRDNNAKLFAIDANKVAISCNLKNKINVIMQTCFFKLTNFIDYNLAIEKIKEFVVKSYSKKGNQIVENNFKAIDACLTSLQELDVQKIINTKTESFVNNNRISNYYKSWPLLVDKKEGNDLPVSTFNPDGSVPTNTSKNEKRGIANFIPTWIPENCIQCGQCSLVCPHAAIRTYLVDSNQSNIPETLKHTPALGVKGYDFIIQCSPLDCTGCSSCVRVCPAKNKALQFQPLQVVKNEQLKNYDFVKELPEVPTIFKTNTVKGIQFKQPYFEFSGACPGCGETPYIRLLTQLFGNKMIIANATGCSSIYGGSAPSCPYSVDNQGKGPAWANSLFEDNAEFGYGMYLANKIKNNKAFGNLKSLLNLNISLELSNAIKSLIEKENNDKNIQELINLLQNEKNNDSNFLSLKEEIIANKDSLYKKSIWIIGGDGWAYDIGFGGIDHVIASGANVNILVLDTEVYSNTGGQSSKSTPIGSVTKFASNGKLTNKKDLGLIAMSYKNVYVAKVAMGANQSQLINALVEAESYNGPSIIIAYAPCINHGIDMGNTQLEMKKAVQSGYWDLYRYNPTKEQPLSIDSLDPTISYLDFLKGENRYANLLCRNPELAQELFIKSEKAAKARRETLKQMILKQE